MKKLCGATENRVKVLCCNFGFNTPRTNYYLLKNSNFFTL